MGKANGAAKKAESIGILGGSFNPIHRRHVDLARCALAEARLSRVLFLPTGHPPHKHRGLASAEHRLEMTRLAILGQPGFEVSRMELDRTGLIYTLDTLRLLKEQYPAAELCYLIGEDTLLDLPNWYKPDEVFPLCRFLVCCRETSNASAHPLVPQLERRGARFTFLSLPPVDISATAIREDLAAGVEPESLAPQVMEYIRIMGLYGVKATPKGAAALYPLLSGLLSDRRLLHSLLVAYTARKLAQLHDLDPEPAEMAGLLHDCAKCMPLSQLQQLAKEHRLLLDRETLASQNLLHGPVSAVLAEAHYGVTDPNILSAIRCHTTGKVGMLPLDMVLYLADKTEPSRNQYPALEEVRRLSETDLIAAMKRMLDSTLEYVAAQKTPAHPSTQRVANWLSRLSPQHSKRSESND